MSHLSIDPVSNYYRVTQTLFGRVMLFFAAGWCGVFLGRLSVAFRSLDDLIRPWEVMGQIFGGGLGVIGEFLIMAFWPVSTANSAASVSVWLFFFAMAVMAVVFVVFIYSEEPAPAWWLGLVGFSATLHVLGADSPPWVSWGVLLVILTGIGSALWWALRLFHPELVESVGDLLRGRSSRPGYSSYAGRRTETRDELREPPRGMTLPTTRPTRHRSDQ